MKRLLILFPTILFILLSGCSDSGSPDNKRPDELADIPETLIVDADLPQNLPSEAAIYKVSYKDFDSGELLEFFHMEPDSFCERDAFGPRFESGDSFLCIYDDDGVLPGGFSYRKNLSDTGTAAVSDFCLDTGADFMKDNAPDDYSDTEALSFLETLGLGQLKVERAYEFSGEDLEAYIRSTDEDMDWGLDLDALHLKGHYSFFYLAQFINDIPFITFPWGISSNNQTYSDASALIFENQVTELRFTYLYDAEQEISHSKIISPEAALNTFIADYNKEMQFDTTTITDISLNYVVTIDKNGMYAQPAYVFEYEYKAKFSNEPELVTVEENKVISAITGEFILSTEVGI